MDIIHSCRQALRHIVLDLLGLTAKPSPCVHILGGHRITTAPGDGSESDRETYRRLLRRLSQQCDFVNIEKAVELIENKTPVKRPTLAFTFDDGFTDCYYSLAPVLEEFGVNAAFFINPGFVDAGERGDNEYINHFLSPAVTDTPGKKPMTWAQLADLHSRGFVIGAHTMDHYMVNNGSVDEIRRQIIMSKTAIEQHLGCECRYFAWPYGRLSQISDEAVDIACATFSHVFSQSDHRHYFSFGGRVLNRRHIEAWWPTGHVRYFISANRT